MTREAFGKGRTGIAGEIDSERGDCRWRQGVCRQIGQQRPFFCPCRKEIHLPRGHCKRVCKVGEQRLAIDGAAGEFTVGISCAGSDFFPRETALLGEDVQLIEFFSKPLTAPAGRPGNDRTLRRRCSAWLAPRSTRHWSADAGRLWHGRRGRRDRRWRIPERPNPRHILEPP